MSDDENVMEKCAENYYGKKKERSVYNVITDDGALKYKWNVQLFLFYFPGNKN